MGINSIARLAMFQATQPPRFAGDGQFLVAGRVNRPGTPGQLVERRYVADGRMEPRLVVRGDELPYDPPRILDRERRTGPQAVALDRAMEAFELAVALRVVGARSHVRHATDANERLEVLGEELRAVVGDDPRLLAGELFFRPLQYDLDIPLGHRFANFPVNDVAAEAIEHGDQMVERAADVDVGNVAVPVAMGRVGLVKTFSLGRAFAIPSLHESRVFEDAIDGRGTHGHHIGVEHHVGQRAVALGRMGQVEVDNRLAFPRLEPMVARDLSVVLVGLAVPLAPVVERPFGDPQPLEELLGGDVGFGFPEVNVIDQAVACVRGNPASV